ncbi:MAG TPA: GNAT family N-acetyltransferase [Gaiellaceae bacterium]|nr:GNAT family N-acetyltransferase [Gaiellaceae bacterium]
MRRLEVQPFADEHLDAAAALLAERHARQRATEPLLPEIADFRAHVEESLGADGASGWVALQDGDVVGYVIGAPRSNEIWGPNIWVELAGHAVRDAETIRDLYAVAAASWVEGGATRHYVLAPATDVELVDSWFRLSFGAQHALGIQEVADQRDVSGEDITVRRAGPEDAEAAVRLDLVLPEHQRGSPVFGVTQNPNEEESTAEYREALAEEGEAILLAERDGRPIGLLVMAPIERSSMHTGLARPDRACILGFAATLPDVRGSGAGLALTNAGLAWAREQGYETVVTDWRETNLLSSRFWPKRGFRRTFLRLYRSIP